MLIISIFNILGEEVWMDSEVRLNKILSKIVGAKEEEICSMNTLSVNLHLMMVSFYKPTETRFKILVEKKAFPSDYHVIATQLQWHGLKVEDCLIEVETSSTDGSLLLNDEDIKKAIYDNKDSLALVLLSGVQYYTGQFFNIPEITKYAQEHGAIVGWDLAHAVGNIPLKLNEWNVDFACWCSYKYLNSGPGALAGIYVNERYCQPNIILDENTKVPLPAKGPVDIPSDIKFPRVDPLRLGGWWGHRVSDRFVMDPAYLPINGAPGFRLSNPAPTLVATLRASLELFDEAGIERLREKSVRLNAYLEYLLQQELSEKVTILTPKDPNQRGCQFSLSFSGTSVEEVHEALTRKGITGDVRKPNVIRVSPTPMYNSFQDVYEFVQVIKSVLL